VVSTRMLRKYKVHGFSSVGPVWAMISGVPYGVSSMVHACQKYAADRK
jgi:hypothetical protein